MRIGFCVSGKGRLFRKAISLKDRLGFVPQLAILDSATDKDLEEFCLKNSVNFYRLDKDDTQIKTTLSDLILRSGADAFFLTFDKLIPEKTVEEFSGKIINVHMSLLPAFKGFRAMSRALESGAKFMGATIHFVDNTVDGGAIIAQTTVSIGPGDNLKAAGLKIYNKLEPLYLQVIRWAVEDRIIKGADNRVWVTGADYSDGDIVPKIELFK